MKQEFIIEGMHFGFTKRENIRVHGESQPPRSEAFVCPVCAECWAKAQIFNQPFLIHAVSCRQHYGHILAIPGSLWIGIDSEFTRALPKEVLTRELLLHLDWVEKGEIL